MESSANNGDGTEQSPGASGTSGSGGGKLPRKPSYVIRNRLKRTKHRFSSSEEEDNADDITSARDSNNNRKQVYGTEQQQRRQIPDDQVDDVDQFFEQFRRQSRANDEIYCLCQEVRNENMIGCDNDACRYQWFHYDCVGVTKVPKGSWYCPECRIKPSKSSAPKKGVVPIGSAAGSKTKRGRGVTKGRRVTK